MTGKKSYTPATQDDIIDGLQTRKNISVKTNYKVASISNRKAAGNCYYFHNIEEVTMTGAHDH